MRIGIALLAAAVCARAQYDPGKEVNDVLAPLHLKLSFENRLRYEDRHHPGFGREPDIAASYLRTRVGVQWTPKPSVKLSALMQDTRAPLSGRTAPGNVRDPADLQEAYLELFPDQPGFGLSTGRRMISYGEARLIGAPQWAYTARTYDHLRLYYRTPHARWEILFASPIKPRPQGFNTPVLGDRVWGTYNVLSLPRKIVLEPYILRHDQNRPGGFTGTGRLETNTFGGRMLLPFARAWRFSPEGGVQTGRVAGLPHRASAYVLLLGRSLHLLDKPLDISGEYKYASGTNRPGRSATFDQLYPAAHDKLGHMDLIAWQNVRNIKGLATATLRKTWLVHVMYDNTWLASRTDALYSINSRPVLRAPAGDAGTHVGQEIDVFTTLKWKHVTFGGGGGRFWAGEFVRTLSPAARPAFFYIFYDYAL